jgi:DNA-binding transcriptional regulator/RsmH inhibitor MraZ
VYPASWLAEQLAKMGGLKADDPQRRQLEALASLAQPAEIDPKTGRVMVKEGLRRHASLAKESVLVGRGLYFQVWDRARHAALPQPAMTLEDALAAAGL